jgi:hypothetical protein
MNINIFLFIVGLIIVFLGLFGSYPLVIKGIRSLVQIMGVLLSGASSIAK